MRKAFLLMPLLGITMFSCQKPNVTVNTGQPTPPYLVTGVHDITIINGSTTYIQMPITVQYSDSAQETVSLSLSALPAGISMDTTAVMTGVPTFSTYFYFYDTTQAGVTPGTYPITLTAIGSKTGGRIFSFNMKVIPQPLYTANIVGAYHNAQSSCVTGTYVDSVWNDATVRNKIWFSNFGARGITVYGTVNASLNVTIPTQIVGAYTVSGSGYYYGGTSPYLYFSNMRFVNGGNTTFCTLNMYH